LKPRLRCIWRLGSGGEALPRGAFIGAHSQLFTGVGQEFQSPWRGSFFAGPRLGLIPRLGRYEFALRGRTNVEVASSPLIHTASTKFEELDDKRRGRRFHFLLAPRSKSEAFGMPSSGKLRFVAGGLSPPTRKTPSRLRRFVSEDCGPRRVSGWIGESIFAFPPPRSKASPFFFALPSPQLVSEENTARSKTSIVVAVARRLV
jgi:hypothetical protein